MQIPVISFKASRNFDTTVELSESDSLYLTEDLQLKVDDKLVLEDELDIQYLSRIKEIRGNHVIAEILNLLNDVSGSSRNDLRGMLHEIRKAREDK